MNNFYDLNENDFNNLVKNLSEDGFARALAGYHVYEKSIIKMEYVEYEANFLMTLTKSYMTYLSENMFYWQLHNNPLRKRVSIKDVMADLVSRSAIVLNKKHNLNEKKYELNVEIAIDIKKFYLEVSVDLITPISTIYEVAKLNLFDLIEQNKKELENESI
jgi:hypothetical protein